MIKRAVAFNAPVNATTFLYLTLAQSNLEFCSNMWSPSTVSDITAIESIQRPVTSYILSYPEKLNTATMYHTSFASTILP